MDKSYMSKLDDSNKLTFEYEPKTSPSPTLNKNVIIFKSAPGVDSNNKIIPSKTSILDLGGTQIGGVITIVHEYMTLTLFDQIIALAKLAEDLKFHDGKRNINYKVNIKDFSYDYHDGTIIVNWKLELYNKGVIWNARKTYSKKYRPNNRYN